MTNDSAMLSAQEEQRGSAVLETTESEIQKKIIPPRPKRRRRKRKFIAGLLAALIPGTGHLYFGLLRKGITFIFLILLDISALIYFSSIGMQINVPLLILLALIIPAIYFYNVYDVLQSADKILRYPEDQELDDPMANINTPPKRRSIVSEPGVSFGFLLLLGSSSHFVSPKAGMAAIFY